jgi:NAD(P)-dependent dehydrogenase (short-subunit alcohol dehydrogenase family)
VSGAQRVALVTGGTRGIGLGIARRLAAEGFALALNGVRPESDVEETLAELRGAGAAVCYARGDIGSRSEREAVLAAVRARYGRLDVLVNNAGVAPSVRADILDAAEESFERLLGINLRGPYFLTQAAARWMLEQKEADSGRSAAIMFVTSVSATVASTNRGDYCISKAGLAMAAQLWAARLAEHGIPVYEVRPGIIRTDMTSAVTEKYDRLIAEGLVPERRWGEPDDVGRVVAMLARGDMPYATGSVLTVDGGLTIPRL